MTRARMPSPQPSPSSRAGNAPGGRPPRPSPLLRARHFPARFGGSLAAALLAALLAALMFLLAGAPAHAQTVAWNATLVAPAAAWANVGTNWEGYGSSASSWITSTTSFGTLSPDSFTVGTTTYTVEVLAFKTNRGDELYLTTDPVVKTANLEGFELIITVDGVAKTLAVSEGADILVGSTYYGIEWEKSVHGYSAGAWTGETITVELREPNTVPDAITDLSAVAGNTQAALSWTVPGDGGAAITEFEYRQKTDGAYGSWLDISGSGATTASHTVTGLTNGTEYTFQVRAVNSVGNAADSNDATATPASGAPIGLVAVSNLGQAQGALSLSNTRAYAQSFTTGSHAAGYDLTDIQLDFSVATSIPGEFSAELRPQSGSNPSLPAIAQLAVPGTLDTGVNSFSAPANTVLDADTTYYVLFRFGGATNRPSVRITASDAEDSGGLSGWSIGDTRHHHDGSWATHANSFQIAVRAEEMADNNPATGAPTITGTAQVGETLTTGTSGIMDADGLATPGYTYQWIRVNGSDADISGATSSTYTLVAADEGKTIKVKVSFTDDASNAETRTSAATAAVTSAQSETVVWNATLTSADNWALGSTYTYDGYGSSAFSLLTTTHGSLSPDSFTVGTTIHTVVVLGVREGTDNRLYLFTDTAVSKSDLAAYAMEFTVDGSTTTLKVKDATDQGNLGFYWAASLHSFGPDDWQAKTITVKLRTLNNPATGAPTISGTAVVGEPMRAVTSGIMDTDGLTSPTYTYQWIRVDGVTESDISGATSSTYTPVAADLGKTIKVRVSFSDDASNAETLTSTATTAVTAAGTVNNPATGAPTITGTAQVGQPMTAATSGIMDSDGLATPGYTYQWIRVNGTDADISGATSITYTPVAADLGKTIKVKVSFTDDASNAETLTSTATAAVTAAVTDDCAETTTTTCSVSPGTPVTGDIESNNDADYFSLALTSGVTYQIDAEGSDTSKGTLDDPFLYLRNASGTELASNEDGGTGRNARIVWTATSTETGYVDVQDSSATNTGTYTLTVSVATVPDAIADLSATPGNTQVTLSWTAFDDGGSTITKFEYRQKTSGSYGSWMDISNSPSTVSHTVTGLTNATAYTFQVRAMNGVGNAGVSNEATATPGYAGVSNVTYVSNIGQGSDDDDSSSQVRAQTFTTGSRAGGYTVTSVDIGSDDAEGDSFTANLSITDPASGNPVAKVATLTVPTSFTAGTLTFIAPPTSSSSPTRPIP